MAAAALIDIATVMRLITARAETIAGVAVAHSRDADPEHASGCWVRVEAPRIAWMPRQRADEEPDTATFECDVWVCVGRPQTKAGALATVAQKVVVAFDGETLRDADTTTLVNCKRPEFAGLVDIDEKREVEIAMVTLRGTVQRQSGRTVEDYLVV